MSDLELWEYAEALFPFHRELFQEHIYVTTLTTVPVGVIQTVATAVGRPDLIMPLIAGVGQVDSAEPSYAMWELSRLDPTSDEFASGFEQFRLDFGSRGPNEWEAVANLGHPPQHCPCGDRPHASRRRRSRPSSPSAAARL